jgi:flavin reductase (DIM6/NTAB) family NADH-FMN oxidoreductase RutF
MSATQDQFRRAMASFATGVTLVTLDNEGKVHGMTANAFASVSLEPLLVLVCISQEAQTHAHMHARKRFGINILSEGQRTISEHYADPDRDITGAEPTGARFDRTAHGTPVLHDALAYLECKLLEARTAGDHTIFIAEVEDIMVRSGKPLVYFRSSYHEIGPELS